MTALSGERVAKVKDAVTWGITALRTDDNLADAIGVMLGHRISGLPVLNDVGEIVGILTEGDLMRRIELGTDRRLKGWRAIFQSPGEAAEDYTRAHGRTVAELMTRDVVSIELNEDLSEAVRLFEERKVRRLPVTDHGRPIGILSRADVLRVLARALNARAPNVARPDAEIEADVKQAIASVPFGTTEIDSLVSNGVVMLTGSVSDERERLAIRVAAENVAGVQSVQDDLTWIDPLMFAQAF